MPTVELNGVRTHYQQRGHGPDVVMIHGLAANMAFWWPCVAEFVRSGFRVTVFDLRGHGKSDMPPRGYTTAQLASDLAVLLDQLEVDRVHLVAHSFGGEISLLLATRLPGRVRSVTLADSRVRCLQPVNRLADWPNAGDISRELRRLGIIIPADEPETGQRLLEELARIGRLGLVHALGGGPGPVTNSFGGRGRRGAASWLRLLATTTARQDFRSVTGALTTAELRLLELPVLAVYGEWSPCLPSFHGLKRIVPGYRGAILRRVGHFHPIVQPQAFSRIVQPFLRAAEAAQNATEDAFPGRQCGQPCVTATAQQPVNRHTGRR